MAGGASSLGIGSGVLTYDVIDIYKNADIAGQIKPLDRKIEQVKSQESALSSLVTATAALKTTAMDLATDTVFQKRTVSVVGDDISVTANDGVAVQDFTITVNQLAKVDIKQSKGFAAEDTIVTNSDTSMTLNIDGSSYTIDVKAGTKLNELRDMINNQTGGKIVASILNTGGNNPYSLVLKSANTGANQAISVSYANSDFLSLSPAQDAQDASFIYNGVTITRSKNSVDDLITGVTIELKKSSGNANNVSIKQDIDSITGLIQDFVDAFNGWNSKISELTYFDPNGKNSGVFQGDTTISRMQRDVKYAIFDLNNSYLGSGTQHAQITKSVDGGQTYLETYSSWVKGTYGLELSSSGILTFDKNKFKELLQNNPDNVEKGLVELFKGVKDRLDNAINNKNGYLHNYETQLNDRQKSLEDERTRMQEFIDKKYEIMAMQFASYDAMISSFTNSYNSLQMAIDAQLSKK